MFKHIVTQINGRITALYTQALALLKALLLKPVNSLLAKFILVFRSVVNLRHRHRHRNQLALIVPLPKKGRPVGITKSARSRTKGNKTAPTPTVLQSTPAGSKSAEVAKQLRQHAKHASKKGK
jgi:hypothetical protein